MQPSRKIFVVSLRRVSMRREQVLRQLLPLGLEFEIVDAVDAQQTKPGSLLRNDHRCRMPDGAVACHHSHIGVLERIVDYGLDYGLILEDDFVIGDSQTLTLANLWKRIPPNADHIQLHMLKDLVSAEYEVREEGEWFNKLNCTNTGTFDYVVSRDLAIYILKQHRIPRMPIDLLYIEISKMQIFDFYDVSEKLIEPDWNMPSCIDLPKDNSGFGDHSELNSSPNKPPLPKVLCYTLALDMKEVKFYRQQAQLMVASLKRSGFDGDIKIVHNGNTEIFDHPHPKVEEIGIDAPLTTALCYRVKFKARDLFSVENYDWVMFLDSDFIIHADLASWFKGPEIIRYATEPGLDIRQSQFGAFLTDEEMENLKQDGINSGAFVIRAEYFHEFMALWEKIDERETTRWKAGDQHAWNRLLLDTELPTKLLTNPEVNYYYLNTRFIDMLQAPVLHYCGCGEGERVLAMQAKFLSHFHTDGDGTLIRLLER